SPTIKEGITGASNVIQLKLGDIKVKGSSSEAYQLEVSDTQGITITGSDGAGVFYGIQSLVARLPLEAWSKPKESISVNGVKIVDAPAFTYRGMHLDVGRNFNNKETVLRLLDLMAFYKLNKFLFNLTEDEGWRLEIEELPELTQIGAFRGHTLDDSEHLIPAYGSGPDRKNKFGSGFFSREDFKEIIRYAYDRHIEVIPEYNMPGHSRAAIKSMEYRYRKYMAEGNEDKALEYRLLDPDDKSVYSSAQHFTDNVVCVCRESVYRFYETVLDDIIEMYQEAEVPLKMVHTGGDEVPSGPWEGSPICQEFLKENSQIDNPRNLQSYFFGRILPLLRERNLITGGWEEVAMTFLEDGGWEPNTQFAGPQVVPYVWNSLRGNEDLGYQLANAGYPTVLCNVTNFYFDLAYDKDPREPGLYWGGFVHTKEAFEFIPYDVFKSTKEDVSGRPFDQATDFEGMERLKEDQKSNIIGLQGQLWSETIKGRDMLETYYLPKMLGLAERAWVGQAEWGTVQDQESREKAVDHDWNIFVNTLARRELVRLEQFNGGYNFHLPAPGASIDKGKLRANSSYPGLTIRYTTDGSEPNVNSSLYIEPVEVPSGSVKLKVFNGQGRGGLTTNLAIE
ncbi:MAG: family 20 glycosylhydrolase, partial [Bacteroidetes bacterium]|nr:family 20 glycosylhydrolase [Bacteroidota bacterium]